MKIKINGKLVCSSKAEYVTLPKNPRTPTTNVRPWQKLIRMSPCNQMIKINAGDKLDMEAYYDFEAHLV